MHEDGFKGPSHLPIQLRCSVHAGKCKRLLSWIILQLTAFSHHSRHQRASGSSSSSSLVLFLLPNMDYSISPYCKASGAGNGLLLVPSTAFKQQLSSDLPSPHSAGGESGSCSPMGIASGDGAPQHGCSSPCPVHREMHVHCSSRTLTASKEKIRVPLHG